MHRTRDDAVARALAFGKHQRVRAWFGNDDGTFVAIGTCRDDVNPVARSGGDTARAVRAR
jgi:hypothetical protein